MSAKLAEVKKIKTELIAGKSLLIVLQKAYEPISIKSSS